MAEVIGATSDSAIELLRLKIDECFVYKIPPFVSSSGHQADSWGLDKPLVTGSLKMVQCEDTLNIRIFTETKEKNNDIEVGQSLFCECPVTLSEEGATLSNFVDSVADSSR
jgi:hypothetical protein